MKFQDSQVELRLRTSDEAVDAGVLLARKYWWPLLGGWLILAIPFFVVACLIPYTFWAIVFFWWFKPLYERLPLQIVSSAIFRQKFSVEATFRGLFHYDTLAWITVFRICPGRSTLIPIAVLEGLESGTGKIRKRRQIVKAPIINTYFLLHIGMFLCELVMICIGVILFMKFFEPVFDETLLQWELIGAQWSWVWNTQSGQILLLSLMLTSSTFIAPFYVCAGFGLYINRRIGLEGWDLYLGFQRLISRLSVGCLLVLVLVPNVDLVAHEEAQNVPTNPSHKVQIRTEIDSIMQRHTLREETVRRPKQPDIEVRSNRFMEVISTIIQLLLVAMVVGLVIWVVIKLRVWEFVIKRSKTDDVLDSTVTIVHDEQMGLELPPNIAAEASRAWRQGRAREALSLLYQGALQYLIVKHSCPIEICDTERTCTRVVAKSVPTHSSGFNRLSLMWQQVAYGKKKLADQEFHHLLTLYEDSFA